MKKLKPPGKGPGCLKYGVTIICALGAGVYLSLALGEFGSADKNTRLFLLCLSAVMLLIILLIWRPRRNAAESRESEGSIEETVKDPVSYISDGRTVARADGKELTDADIEYLRESSYERTREYYENSPNPKFHRTLEEKMAKSAFHAANAEYIDKLEHDIWLPHLYDFDSIDEAIAHAQQALISAQQLADYCSKTSNGRLYFEDMWLHAHNSQNPDFSFIEKIKQRYVDLTLNYEERKHEFELHKKRKDFLVNAEPEVLNVIKSNPGILQKDIWKHFDPDLKPAIGTAVSHLCKKNQITRIKHGSSYELYPK